MSSPSSSTLPATRALATTSCIRFMHLTSVDLQQPDGPIMAVTVFGRMEMVTPSMASFGPYHALRSLISTLFASDRAFSVETALTASCGLGIDIQPSPPVSYTHLR